MLIVRLEGSPRVKNKWGRWVGGGKGVKLLGVSLGFHRT